MHPVTKFRHVAARLTAIGLVLSSLFTVSPAQAAPFIPGPVTPPVITSTTAPTPVTAPLAPLNQPYNVANDSPYTVQSIDNTDNAFHAIEVKQYPGPKYGVTANSLVWTGFLHGAGRTITVHLPNTMTVTAISMQFYENTSQGVLFPNIVHFQVSPNGKRWFDAGDVNSSISPSQTGKLLQTFQIGVAHVSAQYVRVQFPVDVWVLCRNLRVMGSPLTAPSLAQLPPAQNAPDSAGFLMSSAQTSASVHNMLLVYSGAYGAEGTWTPKQFLPMVAYISPSGQVSGQMFDSFLFLPYGTLLGSSNLWQQYLNNLFLPGEQLSALNQSVANAYPQLLRLGINNPTVNVVLTIPYPNSNVQNFGSIPGNSQDLSFNSANIGSAEAVANRKAAIAWYVQTLLAKWNAANFTHLHLSGLYWDSESVVYAAPLEVNLIQYAATLTHQNHLRLFWIPTYEASGLVSWKSLGFDDVIVQSNYMETPSLPVSRVTGAATEAFQSGLGMEIELTQSALTSSSLQARYYNQLVADYLAGDEGNVVHAFYDASQVLEQAAYSQNSSVHNLYVETYDFLINQFTNSTYITP